MRADQFSSYPLVCFVDEPDCQGRLIAAGPEQSVVKLANGDEVIVINKWISKVNGKGDVAATTVAPPRTRGARGVAVDSPPVSLVKPKRQGVKAPDDDLVEQLKRFGPPELKAFAVLNGVWDAKYEALPNPGLVRMNVVNRLRGRVRREGWIIPVLWRKRHKTSSAGGAP